MSRVDELRSQIQECDVDKPFIFISYKRDDAENVYPKVIELQEKGINLWIDKEMKGHVGKDWQAPAFEALSDRNCMAILFFVSEKALVSAPILAELLYPQEEEMRFIHNDILPILTFDLDDLIEGYESVSRYVKSQREKFAENKLNKERLKTMFPASKFESPANIYDGIKDEFALAYRILKAASLIDEKVILATSIQEIIDTCKKNQPKVFLSGTNVALVSPVEPKVEKLNVSFDNDGKITTEEVENIDPYSSIEGNLWRYSAKGAVSYIEWDGKSKNCIVKKGSQVAAEAGSFANLAPAKTMKDMLLEKGVIVGNKFVDDYSCNKISTMINVLTGGSVSMPKTIKDGVLRKSNGPVEPDSSHGKSEDEAEAEGTGKFEYLLWDVPHSANKLATMMHDVFDFIAEKYPEKIDAMSRNSSITSVALKSDVDENKLAPNKMSYFRAKKEHTVGGCSYYVGTSYNRKQGMEQLKRMLELCEGNADAFVITSAPQKSTHDIKSSKGGKKGIDELVND